VNHWDIGNRVWWQSDQLQFGDSPSRLSSIQSTSWQLCSGVDVTTVHYTSTQIACSSSTVDDLFQTSDDTQRKHRRPTRTWERSVKRRLRPLCRCFDAEWRPSRCLERQHQRTGFTSSGKASIPVSCRHRRRSSVNFGGKTFLPENRAYMYEKLTKCPNFTWYLSEKYFPDFLGARALPFPLLSILRLCLLTLFTFKGELETRMTKLPTSSLVVKSTTGATRRRNAIGRRSNSPTKL